MPLVGNDTVNQTINKESQNYLRTQPILIQYITVKLEEQTMTLSLKAATRNNKYIDKLDSDISQNTHINSFGSQYKKIP